MTMLRETLATCKIVVLGISRRRGASISTVVGIALVVLVLIGFLAMDAGFRRTVSGGSSPDIAIALSRGATSEMNSSILPDRVRELEGAPGIARMTGQPLLSAETYVAVNATKASDGQDASLVLRGIGLQGLHVRPLLRIIAGRTFRPGTSEMVVGEQVTREFKGFNLGRKVRLGSVDWTITGVFSTAGSATESELLADRVTVQSVFHREGQVQSVRIRLTQPEAILGLRRYLAADPRMQLLVQDEAAFYASQSKGTSNLIRYMGWPLGIIMAVGALAGALNTMYSSVSERTPEIATMRIIGFGAGSTFLATLLEALVLAVVGASLGVLVALLAFDGLTTSTMNGNFAQTLFEFDVTPEIAMRALVLALIVGCVGGILPAWRAVRQPLLTGMAD